MERDPESGSDGEDISDPPIYSAFTTTELPVVKFLFAKLFSAYQVARPVGLYTAVGKEFMRALGEYSNLCLTTTTISPFLVHRPALNNLGHCMSPGSSHLGSFARTIPRYHGVERCVT